MGRPSKFDADHLLDAAADLVAEAGPSAVTMSAVAEATGASNGSVYHRFPDRPALLAALWLRTVERFQRGVLETMRLEPPQRAVSRSAGYVVAWARRNPRDAAVLLAGAGEFARGQWSEAAREALQRSNTAIAEAITDLARRLGGRDPRDTDRVTIAIVDLPEATIRRYLRSGRPIPADADGLVERAAAALLS
ncbi:TetR/AcrR family transcriptional regulator [Nocardia colli]|uniref:TetR/AcrR family transcriptional regulator n=1 Tax=Nocardia colli TaxID=2545717 RepID=UPI0035D916F1